MKKILLIGHGGFHNRGCEAIVRGTAQIIKHYIPDSQIILSSREWEDDMTVCNEKHIQIEKIVPANGSVKKPSLAWLWQSFDRRILSFNMPFHAYIHQPLYCRHDVVIGIGGDTFTDDYGKPGWFDTLKYAKKAGAKTVIWAASIGPFKNPNVAKKCAEIMKGIDLITVREEITFKYLISLGVINNVRQVADPAFLLLATEPVGLANNFKKAKIKVGIGMSGLMASRYGIKREGYVKTIVDFICHLQQFLDAFVVLVPHVTGQPSVENDIIICKEVQALVPSEHPIMILDKKYDACEMKYCISQFDFFIGARTHSTIASLSTEVPTITIGHSTKAWGINHDLLSTDEFVIPIKDLTLDRLVKCFSKLQERRFEIKEQLHKKIPSMHALAMKGGEHLAEIL